MNTNRQQLIFAFPLPSDNVGISNICLSIHREILKHYGNVTLLTPVLRRISSIEGVRETSPRAIRLIPWKYQKQLASFFFRRHLLQLSKPGTRISFWSRHETSTLREAKQRGAVIYKEKFNCSLLLSQKILSAEYLRLGISKKQNITHEMVEEETSQFEISNFIISPSPRVRESIIDGGIAQEKILDSSFGWSSSSDTGSIPEIANFPRPWFLYVGQVCIRKGFHLLLDYWRNARTPGTLIVMGKIADELAPLIRENQVQNVKYLGHLEKAHRIYSEVDVFVFPSLEEGGPLVTYEAISRGLPSVVSPMGAGAAVRHNQEGIVIEPHNANKWTEAIRTLSNDSALRKGLGLAAKRRSEEFNWTEVAKKRMRLYLDTDTQISKRNL